MRASEKKVITLALTPEDIFIGRDGETKKEHLIIRNEKFTSELLAALLECDVMLVALAVCPCNEPTDPRDPPDPEATRDGGGQYVDYHRCT